MILKEIGIAALRFCIICSALYPYQTSVIAMVSKGGVAEIDKAAHAREAAIIVTILEHCRDSTQLLQTNLSPQMHDLIDLIIRTGLIEPDNGRFVCTERGKAFIETIEWLNRYNDCAISGIMDIQAELEHRR